VLKKNLSQIFRIWENSKSSLLINLIGLTTGLTCALFIYLWVNDEFSFDKFHEKDSQLYQVMTRFQTNKGIEVSEASSGLLAEALHDEVPEIEFAVTTYESSETNILSTDKKSIRAASLYATANFFNIFSYNLMQGSSSEILTDENNIIISDEIAQKLFNTTNDIIGKSIEMDNKKQLTISGIFKKVPSNSSIHFDFILPYKMIVSEDPGIHAWGQNYFKTYLLLNKGTDVFEFNKVISRLFQMKTNSQSSLTIRSYSDRYLYNNYENGIQTGGRISYVRLFSIIAILILAIACINYINLSTARASKKMKEVGLKKIMGAQKSSIVFDFMNEAIIISLLALVISLLIVILLLPHFNEFSGKHILLKFEIKFMLIIVGGILFTSLISGVYPALFLSRFNPANIFQGNQNSNLRKSGVRRGLVIFQYFISIILIVSVLTVYKQMKFIANQDLGYKKDNVIYFENPGKITGSSQTFLSELRKIPGIINASSTAWNFISSRASTGGGVDWEGKNPDVNPSFEVQQVNYDLIETLGFELKEGRPFSEKFSTDNSAIIFNETAIKTMGINDPVGKMVKVWGGNRQIVGVVKDFHFESVHSKINPLFFILNPSNCKIVMVRINEGIPQETIDNINKLYHKFNPTFPFDYKYLDQDFQEQYAAEKRVATLSQLFAIIAIIISSLGLLGLAIFSAERRVKEIGIRKVNGAKISEIMVMLNKDFVKWVAIAFVIATPIAYYVMNKWLESFAYKTELSWWIFALAGILALVIALLTVSWQSWRAATRNPVEALRYE
jgi:putative ABC transport system permease protein